MDKNNKNKNKNIHINASWQIPVPYDSKLHILPTNYLLVATQELYKKSLTLNKKCLRTFLKNFKRMDH